jgi:hypothetical protein
LGDDSFKALVIPGCLEQNATKTFLFYAQMLINFFYPPVPELQRGKDLVAIWQIIKSHFKWSRLKMSLLGGDTVAQMTLE